MSLPQSEDQLRQLAVDEVGRKLLEAAEVIRTRGHLKAWGSADGPRCVNGALAEVCINGTFERAVLRVAAHLNLRRSTIETIYWNNKPERTADEVIAALTAAAFRTGE